MSIKIGDKVTRKEWYTEKFVQQNDTAMSDGDWVSFKIPAGVEGEVVGFNHEYPDDINVEFAVGPIFITVKIHASNLELTNNLKGERE